MPKRVKIVAVSLLIGLFVYALLGFLLLPGVALHLINQQLEQRVSAPAHLEHLEFNPFSLELEAGPLTIGAEEQPDIAWRRLYANLEWKSLWTGAAHLAEVQLDRANVRILFDEQGNLNLARLLLSPENQKAQTQEQSEPSAPFPIRIDRLALIQNSLYFEDRQPGDKVTFAYDAIDLELQNLTTVSQDDANMTLAASGPDGAQLDWQGTVSINPLSSTGQLSVTDAQLQTFWPYVREELPLVLSRGSMGFSSDYHLEMSDSLELSLENTLIDLHQLAFQDTQEQPLLQLESLEVSDTQIDLAGRQVRIGSVTSSSLEAWIERNDDGELNWLALLGTSDEPEDPTNEPWRVLLDQAQFSNNQLHLTDRQPEEDVTLLLSPLELEIAEFDSQGNTPFSLILDTGVGERGQLRAEGQAQITPLSADLKVTTQSLDLRVAQAYLAPFVRLELRSGRLNSTLDVILEAGETLGLSINGSAKIDQLHVLDTVRNRDLLKWEALELDGIAFQDSALAIERAALLQPYGRFIINQDLTTNVDELIIPQPASESQEQETDQAQSQPLAIRVGSVVIEDGSVNFADFSLRPPFGTAIAQLNGNIGTLDNQGAEPAEVDITGNVDRYAPVTVKGSVTPFDPLNSLDITTRFRNVELTTLTPYSSKFAGYRIRKGRLNLDLHYRIKQGQLSAENKVLLEDLQLGERVDSPDAVDLPVRLAVALLKDSKGNIDIELPISGNLNSPEFSVMPIIWQTLGNLMKRAAQAPFKMLAGLVNGGSDADLSRIGFQPGSAELDAEAQQALDTLATALRDRPGLLLEVEGMSAPDKDGPLIGEQRLEREFQQRKFRQLQESGEQVPEDASELSVTNEEKSQMLEEIYQTRLKQAAPEAWQDLPAEERESNMRQAITARWGQNTAILRRLAQQRNDAIKAYLVDNANLDASRVYLLDVGTKAEAEGEQVFAKLELGSQ